MIIHKSILLQKSHASQKRHDFHLTEYKNVWDIPEPIPNIAYDMASSVQHNTISNSSLCQPLQPKNFLYP